MTLVSERKIWADNIRLLSTVGVVILHVASTGLYGFGKLSTTDWMIAYISDSIMRCCVPLFFMLSGALILSKSDSTLKFYKNRFSRVLIPFIFWSFIFNTAFTAFQYAKGNPFSISVFFTDIVFYQGIFSQQAYHLWYVYSIFGMYLLAPAIKLLFRTDKITVSFFVIWTISIILCLPTFQFNSSVSIFIKFICYTGYFGMGYLNSRKEFTLQKKHRITLLFIAITLILFTVLGTLTLSIQANNFNDLLYDYYSPNIIVYSVIIFIILKSTKIDLISRNKIINKINSQSYGIYLSHVLFLSIFERLGFDWNFIHPLIGIPLVSVITLTISTLLIDILSKTPVISKIATGIERQRLN